jgi:hypothetical protein
MIKNILEKIKLIFKREQPKYGAKIFKQQSWLSRAVSDELYKRNMLLGSGLPKSPFLKRK